MVFKPNLIIIFNSYVYVPLLKTKMYNLIQSLNIFQIIN